MCKKNKPQRGTKSILDALYQKRTISRLAENSADVTEKLSVITCGFDTLITRVNAVEITVIDHLKSEINFLHSEVEFWRTIAMKGGHHGK